MPTPLSARQPPQPERAVLAGLERVTSIGGKRDGAGRLGLALVAAKFRLGADVPEAHGLVAPAREHAQVVAWKGDAGDRPAMPLHPLRFLPRLEVPHAH